VAWQFSRNRRDLGQSKREGPTTALTEIGPRGIAKQRARKTGAGQGKSGEGGFPSTKRRNQLRAERGAVTVSGRKAMGRNHLYNRTAQRRDFRSTQCGVRSDPRGKTDSP